MPPVTAASPESNPAPAAPESTTAGAPAPAPAAPATPKPHNVSLYEGLFLMSAAAGADLNGSVEFIREVLNRAGAEILVLRKWDERKLAYPIKGQKRGLYIIAYFRVKHTMLANIDRDCNLSEQVIRNLVIRADHMGEVEIEMEKKEVAHTRTEAALRSDDRSRPSGRAAPKSSPADEEAPVGLSTGEFQDN